MFNFLKSMLVLLKSNSKKMILTEIKNAVKSIGGEIIILEYSVKYFGNIILHFKKNDKLHEYVVDRGEIYYNKKWICNNSYIHNEDKQPYQKLIEIVIATAT